MTLTARQTTSPKQRSPRPASTSTRVSGDALAPPAPGAALEEQRAWFSRVQAEARKGDPAADDLLRTLYEADPEARESTGDRARQSIRAWTVLSSGGCTPTEEVILAKVDALIESLAGPDAPPLERLLSQRAVACWLHVNYVEVLVAQVLAAEGGLAWKPLNEYQRWLDRSHNRFLRALKVLAQVRALKLPAVQLNVAQQQVNVASGGHDASRLTRGAKTA